MASKCCFDSLVYVLGIAIYGNLLVYASLSVMCRHNFENNIGHNFGENNSRIIGSS